MKTSHKVKLDILTSIRKKALDYLTKTQKEELMIPEGKPTEFAHPGYGKPIVDSLEKLGIDLEGKLVLDIGCGKGNSAQINHSFGLKVIGLDINSEAIEHATNTYLECEFHCVDATNKSDLLKILQGRKIDIIRMDCSFIRFNHNQQKELLKTIRKCSHPESMIIIFGYADLTNGDELLELNGEERGSEFNPIRTDNYKELLSMCGWGSKEYVNLNQLFFESYQRLCKAIIELETDITKTYGGSAYKWAYENYTHILKMHEEGKLGGCIVIAKAVSNLEHQHAAGEETKNAEATSFSSFTP